jgi:hypothetical protein
MSNSNIIWSEFLGHGFVAGPFNSSVVLGANLVTGTSDIYTVVFLWGDVYGDNQRMIDNVGARVYIEGFLTNRDVPDGYYTITAATTTSVTITSQFDVAPSAGAPVGTASIRIEDFYRFCNAVPDFVTGTDARSRWLTIITPEGFSNTFGQELSIRGGVSSFDGFSFEMIFVDDAILSDASATASQIRRVKAFQKIIRTTFELATDTASDSMVTKTDIDPTDATMTKRGTTLPANEFMSINVSFGFAPVLINREAVLITSDAGAVTDGRDLNILRGLLGTRDGADGFAHTRGGLIYDGLQTGQASLCRVRNIPDDALTFELDADYGEIANQGLVYSGIVENILYGQNLNTVTIEISPQIFGSQKQSFSAKITQEGKILEDLGTQDYVVLMDSQSPTLPWEWIKLNSDIAVRLRAPRDASLGNSNRLSQAKPGFPGVFITKTLIDYIAWDPDDLTMNDNYVVFSDSKDDVIYDSKIRTNPRILGAGFATVIDGELVERISTSEERERDNYCIRSYVLPGLEGRGATENFDVVHVDMEQFLDKTVEPCHVFENAKLESGLDDEELTPSFSAKVDMIDLLLQILTSNSGDGTNGSFDILPKGLGLGINKDDIDYDSFGWDLTNDTGRASLSTISPSKLYAILNNVIVTPKDVGNIQDWLTKKILQPINLAIVQNSEGKIRLADTTDLKDIGTLPTLDDTDLEFEHGSQSFSFKQVYDASNLFDRIVVKTTDPTKRPSDGQNLTVTTIPSETVFDGEDDGRPAVKSRLFSFIQAEPLLINWPFLSNAESIITYASNAFTSLYSRILPKVTFSTRKANYEVGDKVVITLASAIDAGGSRGLSGVGLIIDKKTNIFAEQSRYTAVIVAEVSDGTVWAASAEVAAGSTSTTINVEANSYTDAAGTYIGWEEDTSGFNAEDFVLIYDENFVMLSVDAGGNPDSREISSIVDGVSITIASSFTDGAGTPFTAAATDIIMHDVKANQTAATQKFQAWFDDGSTRFQ